MQSIQRRLSRSVARRAGISVALSALMVLAACSEHGAVTPTPPTPFTAFTSANQIAVIQGQSKSISLEATGVTGSAGAVQFSVTGMPPGVRFSFAVTDDGAQRKVWAVTAATTIAIVPGTYKLTISATDASGAKASWAPIEFWVQPFSGPYQFLVTADAALDISAGLEGSLMVVVDSVSGPRDGVTLTLENAPPGLRMRGDLYWGPTARAVQLAVDSSVALGNYPFTVVGTGRDGTRRTAQVTLRVVTEGIAMDSVRDALTSPGGSAAVAFRVRRKGMQNVPVTFDVDGLGEVDVAGGAAGAREVVGTFAQNPLLGTETLYTLSVGGAIARGGYSVRVTARAGTQVIGRRVFTLGVM